MKKKGGTGVRHCSAFLTDSGTKGCVFAVKTMSQQVFDFPDFHNTFTQFPCKKT